MTLTSFWLEITVLAHSHRQSPKLTLYFFSFSLFSIQTFLSLSYIYKLMYEQALQSLKEAFPTVDPVVIEAILDSHRGQADQCFEPLLRISIQTISQIPRNVDHPNHYQLSRRLGYKKLPNKRHLQT
ncbi:unnamed protein product [Umbelopsis ramanniana]